MKSNFEIESEISGGKIAAYLLALLAMYAIASNGDYNDQRKMECANRSTTAWDVSWDSASDKCIKEYRNGQTKENR